METMAPTRHEKLKSSLLLFFVAASVVLVGLIWAEGLSDKQPSTPGYYRDTFVMDPNIYLTITAEAAEREGTPATGTPTPGPDTGGVQGEGPGHGRGEQGRGAP
jgi:hypothetical protein